MTGKKKSWTKSAFSDDILSTNEEPVVKKLRSSSNKNSSVCLDSLKRISKADKTITPTLNNHNIEGEITLMNENVHSSDWIENFVPKTLADLAVHPKKLAELQDWLKHCDAVSKKYLGQICLISGPAGSGKTAALKVIAKEMQYEIIEWINPVDTEYVQTLGDQDNNANNYKEAHVELFKRFLFRSSRYKSLFEQFQKRLILIEDFPNAFLRNSEGFNEILGDYKNYGKAPLVFLVTDSKSKNLNISYTLFPDQIKEQYGINHISFNAVSTTLMKKALKRICDLMTNDTFKQFYTHPSSEIVDSINLASQGDVRNAVINLHFGSLKGAPRLHIETRKTSTKSKRKEKFQNKLTAVGRDESITMMHALGRVFNPKYLENIEPKTLQHSPEQIADSFSSEPKSFVDFVYRNYLPHFDSIENVLPAIDSLSYSDMIMAEYREERLGVLGLNIALRGVMVSNENPVSGWMPVRGPKRYDASKELIPELKSLGLNIGISKSLLATDYRSSVNIIKSKAPTFIIN